MKKKIFSLVFFIVLLFFGMAFWGCAYNKGDAYHASLPCPEGNCSGERAEAEVTRGVEKFSPFSSDKEEGNGRLKDDNKHRTGSDTEKFILSDKEKSKENDAIMSSGIFEDKSSLELNDEKNFKKESKGNRYRVFIPSYVDEHNIFHGKRYIYFTIENGNKDSTD